MGVTRLFQFGNSRTVDVAVERVTNGVMGFLMPSFSAVLDRMRDLSKIGEA